MQEGYFVSYRGIGLPIRKEDFDYPYLPYGTEIHNDNYEKPVTQKDAADPKEAAKSEDQKLSEGKVDDAERKSQITHSMRTFLNTFMLTDDKLKMNNQYSVFPNTSKVSDSWYAITYGANGVPVDIKPEDKEKYEKARAMLIKEGNPTPEYRAYMQYQDEWKSKKKAYLKAFADAYTNPDRYEQWPLNGVLYSDDVKTALDRWQAFGYKSEIENAINTLSAQGTDPAMVLISKAKNNYSNCLLNFPGVGDVPYTFIIPNSWYDPYNDEGWTQYTSIDLNYKSNYEASSTSYSVGGAAAIGLFCVAGAFSDKEEQSKSEINVENVRISFKYCSVDIIRPWLLTSLLYLKNWYLVGDYKKNCISNGQMSQEIPPVESNSEFAFLPSIVTSLILIKDLSIQWSNMQQTFNDIEKVVGGAASIGFGPFMISGGYKHGDSERDLEYNFDGETLTVSGIQLIGYISEIIPPCPALDSIK